MYGVCIRKTKLDAEKYTNDRRVKDIFIEIHNDRKKYISINEKYLYECKEWTIEEAIDDFLKYFAPYK